MTAPQEPPQERPSQKRPRGVDTAFWLLLIGAILLVLGGLMAATLSFDTVRGIAAASVSDETLRRYLMFHRGAGVFCVLAGLGLGFLAGRMRKGDPRFRRAAMALGLVIIVLVGLLAVFAGTHVLSLLALLPIIVGVMLLSRPAVAEWFASAQEPAQEPNDG